MTTIALQTKLAFARFTIHNKIKQPHTITAKISNPKPIRITRLVNITKVLSKQLKLQKCYKRITIMGYGRTGGELQKWGTREGITPPQSLQSNSHSYELNMHAIGGTRTVAEY